MEDENIEKFVHIMCDWDLNYKNYQSELCPIGEATKLMCQNEVDTDSEFCDVWAKNTCEVPLCVLGQMDYSQCLEAGISQEDCYAKSEEQCNDLQLCDSSRAMDLMNYIDEAKIVNDDDLILRHAL